MASLPASVKEKGSPSPASRAWVAGSELKNSQAWYMSQSFFHDHPPKPGERTPKSSLTRVQVPRPPDKATALPSTFSQQDFPFWYEPSTGGGDWTREDTPMIDGRVLHLELQG